MSEQPSSPPPPVPDASAGAAGAGGLPRVNAGALAEHQAGVAAFNAGDLAGARERFDRAVALDRYAYMAQAARAVVLERTGEPEEALKAYDQALALAPSYGPAVAGYSGLLVRQGRLGEAERTLKAKQAAKPDSAEILAALAEVKSLQGESAAAQSLASQALKQNPDYRPAMLTMARDHYRQHRVDLALYALRAILDGFLPENPPRDENNGEARLLRATIYLGMGNRSAALQELERVVTLRPDLVGAHVGLAALVLEAGNAPRATALLEHALRYEPRHLDARLDLGDAYRLQGRTEEAEKQLVWVRGQAPTLAEVHYDLGLLYLFADAVPGKTPLAAVEAAIVSLEEYQRLRPRGGAGDDVAELITRAKSRKSILEAEAEEAAEAAKAPPAETPPAEGAPEEGGGDQPTEGGEEQPAAPEGEPAAGSMPDVE